ncbi:hypothetical protein D5S18_18480 [Nocardia panacis]|uniref:Uncharacterized protein n=1 Tax=Nocardia panacis TaxID=2340916 RepID=A0A3A4KK11_9NOCA|nr:hypothetical protein [Nocardia panacis]RJO74140.1 hypothetical protein D5S18_18480 [Nocardia panacis]
MSPLAHVVEAAVVGGVLAAVLLLGVGTVISDCLEAARAAASVDEGDDPDVDLAEKYADILDDEVELPELDEPDWGAEWDRARDRDRDYRWGAA